MNDKNNESIGFAGLASLASMDAKAYCKKGGAYDQKGDYDQAIADYSQAIRLNPNGATAKQNLEILKQRLNDIRMKVTPNGEVDGLVTSDNTIYLDPNKMNANTPIYLFGHLWIDFVKKNNTQLYNKLMRGAMQSKHFKDVNRNPAYKDKPRAARLEEAIARAIGDSGEDYFLNRGAFEAFRDALRQMWRWIMRKLGIRGRYLSDMNLAELADMTFEELAQAAVEELLSGQEMKEHKKKPTAPITDSRDGKSYKTVKIGDQVWLAENLNYETPDSKYYGNDPANGKKYGRLYTWDDAIKACPFGWHLPSDDEWDILMNFVGGYKTACKKLKSKNGWAEKGNGTDEYGFSALPGGVGDSGGNFFNADCLGGWWSVTETNASKAWLRGMHYSRDDMGRDSFYKTSLFSVRCVRD